nr:MAG TPA: hypothetical protein [Myoviridae sp. ctTS62]
MGRTTLTPLSTSFALIRQIPFQFLEVGNLLKDLN